MVIRKTLFADSLFGVQIIGALIFCGAQFIRSLSDVRGASLAQFGLVFAFMIFQLLLSLGAHRANPSRLTRQGIATYLLWLALMGAVIIAVATNTAYRWDWQDTRMLLIAGGLTLAVGGIALVRKDSAEDPMIRGLLAIVYKSVPQVLLIWKIFAEGHSGIPAWTIWVGHFTIFVRLMQIALMIREAGWDRHRFWLVVSESANELSWTVTTIAWLGII